MSWAIETQALTKRYPPARFWRRPFARPALSPYAVDRVTLAVREGELFGLLGPNGAGKTTLVKMLCTLVAPTSGTASVGGYPLQEETAIKAVIGLATSDERSFYWRLTGRQNLEFFAHLHHLLPEEVSRRVQAALSAADLEEIADRPFQTYSTGMRQRLAIARALLHQPRILFLDEPTKGLDPLAARQLHRLVRDELVTRQGITVFLTTHNLEEAAQLCDRLAIMHRGRLLACGTLDELRTALFQGERYAARVSGLTAETEHRLTTKLGGLQVQTPETGHDGSALVRFDIHGETGAGSLQSVLDVLSDSGASLLEIRQESLTLEAVFERLVVSDPGPNPESGPAKPEPACGRHGKQGLPAPSQPASARLRSSPLRTVLAFLKRDLLSEASYRFSFFLQFFNIFFQVLVFYFISRLLGPAAATYLAAYGGDYFSFVLIGIAFAGYFSVGLSSFSSSLRLAQTTGTLEAMLTTPTSLSAIILSSSLWDYLMTTVKVVVYLAVGVLFLGVDLQHANYPAALVILLFTLLAFSSIGVIAASFIMVLKRGDPVTWIFSAVSSLVGGVYYPVTMLPDALRWLSRLLPITYALNSMRLALLEGAPFDVLLPDILALAGFSAVLLPLSLLAFRYAVRMAKVDGSLTQY